MHTLRKLRFSMGAEPLKSNNLAPVFSFYITGFTFENKPRPALFLLPVVSTVWLSYIYEK